MYYHTDITIGNPPFQNPNGRNSSKKLYIEILKDQLDYCDKLIFITPSGVLAPNQFNIINKHLKYINVSKYIKNKYFNKVGSSFCYFEYDKEYTGDTEIITDDGIFNIDVKDYEFLPYIINSYTIDLLNDFSKLSTSRIWHANKLDKRYHNHEDGKYIVNHTNHQHFRTNEKLDCLNKIKLFTACSGNTIFKIIKGEYCSGQCLYTIFDNMNEAEEYRDYLNNDNTIQEYLKYFKWSGFASKRILERL